LARRRRVFQNADIPERGSHVPASHWLALVGFVGLCLLVGAAEGAVTAVSVRTWYLTLIPPPGTPPNGVFGPIWGTLYMLIGISAWLIWRQATALQRPALRLWGWQLLVNAAWSPAFFGLHSPALGLGVIAVLLLLIGLTIRRFYAIRPLAAALMMPYAVWTCYATYLNAGFLWLNPG
jgi:translocator protein